MPTAKATEEAAEKAGADVAAELAELRDEMKAMLAEAKALAAKHGRAIAGDVADVAEATGAAARRQGEKMGQDVEAMIRERPLISVLGAFGIGFLAAKLHR